jgi:hypothetical protein
VLTHVVLMQKRKCPPVVRLAGLAGNGFAMLEGCRPEVGGIAWRALQTAAGAALRAEPLEVSGIKLPWLPLRHQSCLASPAAAAKPFPTAFPPTALPLLDPFALFVFLALG